MPLDRTDENILRSAATGEGVIPLTPELFKKLAQAASEAFHNFKEECDRIMTPERAALVRGWRVDDGGTWRWVARQCSEAWGGDWGSSQLMGEALCEKAAVYFGEDGNLPPWN